MSTSCCTGVEELVPDGSVKLGFRAHYPQIETKLTVRGADMDDIERKLAPVEAEVRKRLGNFILAEDDDTLEGVILEALPTAAARWPWSRLSPAARWRRVSPSARRRERVPPRHRRARPRRACRCAAASTTRSPARSPARRAEAVAQAARRGSGASHALAVLIELDDGPDRIDFGGSICLAIATETEIDSRRSRIFGGREWVRLGAVELGLDCLRRHLQGLPVTERIDFERT